MRQMRPGRTQRNRLLMEIIATTRSGGAIPMERAPPLPEEPPPPRNVDILAHERLVGQQRIVRRHPRSRDLRHVGARRGEPHRRPDLDGAMAAKSLCSEGAGLHIVATSSVLRNRLRAICLANEKISVSCLLGHSRSLRLSEFRCRNRPRSRAHLTELPKNLILNRYKLLQVLSTPKLGSSPSPASPPSAVLLAQATSDRQATAPAATPG